MSTPSSPVPPEQNQQPERAALSEPARIINTFVAPQETFQDVKRKASWFAPWLVLAIFAVIFAFVAVQKLDMTQVVRESIERSPMAQRRLEQLTPEQRERGMAFQVAFTKVSFFAFPVIVLIVGLIIGAVLMGVFNFGFGTEVSFQQALSITFYAFLPGIIGYVLLVIAILLRSDPNSIDLASGNPIATSPAFFMDWSANKFLYALASGADIIRIWQIILLGLGFATVASSPRRKLAPSTAIVTIFAIYAVLVIGRAGFATAF